MYENARSAGGQLTVTTLAGSGHRVCFSFPANNAAELPTKSVQRDNSSLISGV
jgi:hypothetical protein